MNFARVGQQIGKIAKQGFQANMGTIQRATSNLGADITNASKQFVGQARLLSNKAVNGINGLSAQGSQMAQTISRNVPSMNQVKTTTRQAMSSARQTAKGVADSASQAASTVKGSIPDMGQAYSQMSSSVGDVRKTFNQTKNLADKFMHNEQFRSELAEAAKTDFNNAKATFASNTQDFLKKNGLDAENLKGLGSIGKEAFDNAKNGVVNYLGADNLAAVSESASKIASAGKTIGSGVKKFATDKEFRQEVGKDVSGAFRKGVNHAMTYDMENWGSGKYKRLGMEIGQTADSMTKGQIAKSMFLNDNGTISKTRTAMAGIGAIGAGVGAVGAIGSAITPDFGGGKGGF